MLLQFTNLFSQALKTTISWMITYTLQLCLGIYFIFFGVKEFSFGYVDKGLTSCKCKKSWQLVQQWSNAPTVISNEWIALSSSFFCLGSICWSGTFRSVLSQCQRRKAKGIAWEKQPLLSTGKPVILQWERLFTTGKQVSCQSSQQIHPKARLCNAQRNCTKKYKNS